MPKGGGASGGGGGGRGGGSGKSSKSKSKSKSKTKSKGGFVAGGGGGGAGGGGNDGFSKLPVWARVLIILLIVWFIIFLISLFYFLAQGKTLPQQFKRKKRGEKFRLGHVFGHALLVSTGLWLPVLIYKKIAERKKNKSGTYAKIEEGHGKEGNSSTNHDYWYGGAGSKYDPPQYQSPMPAPAPSPSPRTPGKTVYYMPPPPSHAAETQPPPRYS
ncbi:uncharacterized protein CTRU02_207275 [Colletotrichum truncatum]|uniref:Uncharacterized protein n=1 Tax=Colletotrichum truncatum TaxID=5467 RepID=A0ACC3Z0F2_COLTU